MKLRRILVYLVQLNRQNSVTAKLLIAKVYRIQPHFCGQFMFSVVNLYSNNLHVYPNALKDMASRKGNLAFSARGNSDRRDSDRRDGASDSRYDSQYAEPSPRQISPSRGTPRSTPGSYERDNEAIPPLNGDYRSLPANLSPQNQTSLLFSAPNPYTQSQSER